jgi:hypothetical protein
VTGSTEPLRRARALVKTPPDDAGLPGLSEHHRRAVQPRDVVRSTEQHAPFVVAELTVRPDAPAYSLDSAIALGSVQLAQQPPARIRVIKLAIAFADRTAARQRCASSTAGPFGSPVLTSVCTVRVVRATEPRDANEKPSLPAVSQRARRDSNSRPSVP